MKRLTFLLALSLTACGPRGADCPRLTRLHVVDRNGLSEIISNRDRLGRYEGVDFTKPQPYQQVSRTFAPDGDGHVPGLISCYYPNGQIQQSLQVLDGRAFGLYQEWHPNGQLRVHCQVVGGPADLEPASQHAWLFEGLSEAWDADGNRIASVNYSKGALEGPCTHFHPNGTISQEANYRRNLIVDEHRSYYADGQLTSSSHFIEGKRHGLTQRYWPDGSPQSSEDYVDGLIKEARYLNPDGNQICQIQGGQGRKAIFEGPHRVRLESYREGAQQGRIDCYDTRGHLTSTYNTRNNLKHGEEIIYFVPGPLVAPSERPPAPKLSLNWVDGQLQGTVRTWYSSGVLESCREMAQNKKNGIASAWYRDGSLMLMEEYESGRLTKGDYYRRGDTSPTSRIDQGKGTATLYDGDGHLLRRVIYRSGQPIE